MTSINRIKKIQEKLHLGRRISVEYMVSLVICKDRTFEESQKPPCGFNDAWCNGKFSVMKGKKYLGLMTYAEKPKVAEKLKEIYLNAQDNIKEDATAGMGLLWITLSENEEGLISVR